MIDAVIFDLDGVILDSEPIWDHARREIADAFGGRWLPDSTESMQGMSSLEWSAYLEQSLGVSLSQEQIVAEVVDKVLQRYATGLPLVHHAVEAVRRVGERWRLALASSSNRVVIDSVLDLAGLRDSFEVAVSSEEVPRGKPSPDVYLEAAHRLGVSPGDCCAVEDSANGIRSAAAAGMAVIAVPNPRSRPPQSALDLADVVARTLDDVTADTVLRARTALEDRVETRLDEVEDESFPASDPHADWAGPPR